MKTIILILLFAISLSAQSSDMLLLFSSSPYTKETQAYIRATTGLSSTRIDTVDTFVRKLKDSMDVSNLSDFFDMFNIPQLTEANSLDCALSEIANNKIKIIVFI